MDNYESRANNIRTMVRACLDSHEEDEDFFSASDGDESSPPSSLDGNNFSAANRTAACTASVGIASDTTIADDGREKAAAAGSPRPVHHERGPTPQTEHSSNRLIPTRNSTLKAGGPPHNDNDIRPEEGGATCNRQETTVGAEMNSCIVGRSNTSNTSDQLAATQTLTAATSSEPCGVASFAGISVSGVRLLLELPIFPDVDGVLFELLLTAMTSDRSEECIGRQSIDAVGDSGRPSSRPSSRPTDLEGPRAAKAANGRPERNADVCGGDTFLRKCEVDGKSVDIRDLGGDRTMDSRPCTFVGAVALLLSEITGTWRDIESPLFDSAGGVAGTIKLAAQVLGGEARGTREAETTVVRESTRHAGGAEVTKTATHQETEPNSTAAGVSTATAALKAVTSPQATFGLARSRRNDPSPVTRLAKPRGGPRERRGVSAPTSPCCDRRRGSCIGSGGPTPMEPAEQRILSGCTSTALESHQLQSLRADEMAPRAMIIFKGVKLPFRWFRSDTARGMDKALRDMLGINDASIAAPLLYDVSTGDRVSLEPDTPSGRVFLAVLERHSFSTKTSPGRGGGRVVDRVSPSFTAFDRRLRPTRRHHSQNPTPLQALFPRQIVLNHKRRYGHGTPRRGSVSGRFRHHDQAPGRPRSLSIRHSPPNRPLRRRSASDGDLRWRFKLAATKIGTTREQGKLSAEQTHFSNRAAGKGFAEEVIELQQQRRHQREQDRLEVKRRQEMDHAKAKAVACQLACSVLCRGHRTRVLVAALWRWRSRTAGLKMEHVWRDEQKREHEQVIARLERLRQDVASLTASAHEELVAVSIDALETDLHSPSAGGMRDQYTHDLATECRLPKRAGHQDKGSVDRAVTALKMDISRLDGLRVQKAQCLQERLREWRGIQEAGSASRSLHGTAAATDSPTTVRVQARASPISPGTSTSLSAKLDDETSVNPSESSDLKRNERSGGVSPEHPGRCKQPSSPTIEGQNKYFGVGAGAGAGARADVDGSMLPSLPSSPPQAAGAAGTERASEGIGNLQRVHGDGWGTSGSDDQVLEYFLAHHATEATPPVGDGTEGQSPLRSAITAERYPGNGALASERDAKVLWALFRVFSDCPRPSPNTLPPPSPGVAGGGAAQRLSTTPDFHDRCSPRRVDLLAFLEIGTRAGLLAPAAKATRPYRCEGSAWRPRRKRGGEVNCGRGRGLRGDGGGARSRVKESGTERNVTAPGETFFLLSPADAASIFARVVRRYGSADAAVHNHTKRSYPIAPNQPHQQHTRRGRGRHDCGSHREEGLDFQQFVSAIGGVIELLTVGCDDGVRGVYGVGHRIGVGGCSRSGGRLPFETAVFPRELGARITKWDSGERRISCGTGTDVSPGSPLAGFGEEDGQNSSTKGKGDCREKYGGGISGRRVTVMTPELAKNRLVRLAKALAEQELQARDRQARETLALLDPSLQSTLDLNAETLREIFQHYCRKFVLRSGSKPRPHGHTSPRIKNNTVLGIDKLGGGSGAERVSRLATPTLSFEGGKTFATDVGLVATTQQLAEVWGVAWSHQRAGEKGRKPADEASQAVQDASMHSPVASKLLSFSGFLDFLGRCALRFGQPMVDNNHRREHCAGAAALPVHSPALDAFDERRPTGESARTWPWAQKATATPEERQQSTKQDGDST